VADYIAIPRDEWFQRLDRVQKFAREAKHLVEQAYKLAETQFSRPDYASVGVSTACAQAGDLLAAANAVCQEAADELTILMVPDVQTYRAEMRVGFPHGITHFTVDNGGTAGAGRLTVHGRNDYPTSLPVELFEVGDKVNFLASSELNAAALNVFMTIASITGNQIEFTAPFAGGAPGADPDYALHVVLRTRHV
jgi:hypothetical protein